MLEGPGKIGGRVEPKLLGDLADGDFCFGQKLARLEDSAVLQKGTCGATAGRVAAARQVGRSHAQGGGKVRNPHAGAEIPFQKRGIARNQTAGRIGAGGFDHIGLAGLPFQPDADQPGIGFGRAVMGGNVAFKFTRQRIKQDVDFLLRMDVADAQMQRSLRQDDAGLPSEKHRRPENLRPGFEGVHDACRDEDRIMCRVAARHPRDRDSALTFGEPQQARFGQRAHRFNPPAPPCGKTRNCNQPKRRGGQSQRHDGVGPWVSSCEQDQLNRLIRGTQGENCRDAKLVHSVAFWRGKLSG